MSDPYGFDGFAFCEFTAPDPDALGAILKQFGFVPAACAPDGTAILFRQGEAALILNKHPDGHAARFRAAHGPSACAMGFRVRDAGEAIALAVARGAVRANSDGTALSHLPAIEGVGGALLYLVSGDPFEGWDIIPCWQDALDRSGAGLCAIDHMTHNLHRGQMRVWSEYYARLFGFEEQRHFDIRGQATGLLSQAMRAPDGRIRIPLNESQDEFGQIAEFIRDYGGEGIQHIAFSTDDIHATVDRLRAAGVRFQDTPDAYYEMLDARIPGHGEDIDRLRANRILVDGDAHGEGLLLQIFTEPVIGPIFFEIIQRKGNQGFGAGNFQALYESIERDQIRRGVVPLDS